MSLQENFSVIRIFYIDTSALIMCFTDEKPGSDVVKWIIKHNCRYLLTTSQIGILEFKTVIKRKYEDGKLSCEQMRRILHTFKSYVGEGRRISVKDIRPPAKKTTDYINLANKYKKKVKKMGRDFRHLAVIINYLRYFSGDSKPRVIVSDKEFKEVIKSEGYEVINPRYVTIDEFKKLVGIH
jgi:predicted nucleic acid-binding protein